MITRCLLLAAFACLATAPLRADVVAYQGRLQVNGAPLNGNAQVKFELLNPQGVSFWSSGELTLPVSNGVYNVRLGDTTAGMPAITGATTGAGNKLRVWLKEHDAWQLAGTDVSLPAGATAQSGGITATQADAILNELREIKTLLARQAQAPAPAATPARPAEPQIVTIPVGNGPSLGDAKAPVVLVEFSDFQCGFCKKFHDDTFPALKKTFVDSGKVRVLTRNLPLAFHPQAEPAARGAFCANEQKKYWPMREALFKISGSLSPETIEHAAQEIGLDVAAFRKCVDRPETKSAITGDGTVAQGAAISGTPTFVIGKLDHDKVTGVRLVGAQPASTFEAEINKALSARPAPAQAARK